MQISIVVQCPNRFSEVLPDEPENTEFVIEDCVSRALLELFGMVIVETVDISDVASEYEQSDARSYGA
jgi:hypothetical protein